MTKKRIAILQSNYIPWKGYFDFINMVDEFVLFDTVQYTKNDWRNRNKIFTSQGLTWLTIPVRQESLGQKIKDIKISDKKWAKRHWQSIICNYSKAKYFKEYKAIFEEFYLNCEDTHLSQINYSLIKIINEILGITTKISWSTDYKLLDGQTEKLLGICQQAGAAIYLSGPAAKNYFDEELAQSIGIKVEWMDYSGYPEYQQLHSPFEHGVSIIDLIFNEGDRAKEFLKSF